ncbi:uncharacterized protein LOC135133272 isoform X12 [Zophobas morio]|uniref:uncharacterized protein LOC135133272 isoform X12 n=1 Tax=Zophobas morio TaxID=2755281 RepID=UPI00308325CC
MTPFTTHRMSKVKQIVEKFCATELDDDAKKTFVRLWSAKPEEKLVLRVCAEWLTHAVATWSTSKLTSGPRSICFTLNLTALLCENESTFNQLNNNNFFAKLVKATKATQSKIKKVKLAYIKLLSTFLEHAAGVEWLVACCFWEDIIEWSLTGDDDVVAKSTLLLQKILDKTIDSDENFCDRVVKKIMVPLGENIYRGVKVCGDVSDVEALQPSLKLMGNILEHFLNAVYLEGYNFRVLFVFLRNFHLEERICDFMIIAQNKRLLFDLSKIMFVMQFLELYANTVTGGTTLTKVSASVVRIQSNFMANMVRGTYLEQVDFCPFSMLFWKLMESKVPTITARFSGQFMFLLSIPFGCVIMKYLIKLTEIEEAISHDQLRSAVETKVWEMVSYDYVRVMYFWTRKISDGTDTVAMCKHSFLALEKCLKYLSRDHAVTFFQCFVYFLVDLLNSAKESPEKVDVLVAKFPNIDQIFEIVGTLTQTFQIGLKDAVETTYVLPLCFDFLALASWSSQVVLSIINLINTGSAHYMAPNLALLMEDTPDSPLALLGPLLYSKLLNDHPDIQRASLDVVRTIARISSTKFPSLQKVLMDSELPTLVVKMSTCDGESFVRATAIKCLQEMIQVEEIWNNALKTEDLSQKMRDILLNETEGIVRVEAATFMCVAYEHQQFPKDSLDAIYETMIYSSTTDLHWEVKVRALNFWDKVIKNHLQNQGMIDGSFPNVTFSKEHRKIVTLTDSEIRKRLLKVLGQLSAIGCLGVLTAAIKDDCDMEVSKTAVKITQKLVDLLKKYAVGGECSGPTSPIPTESGMSMSSGISVDESMDSPRSSQPDLNEEIIEQIVNAKDASLLKGVYAPSDYGSVSNYDFQVRKIVTPTEFLQFTHQDLNNIIAEKKKWLNGIEDLGSLLDDMLKTYDEDVNSMDCY